MFFNLLQQLRRDESGATMVEYSILIGLITVALVTVISTVGTDVLGSWTAVETAL